MINITFNNLSKADGSALIDQNDTIVQATVFGPVDIAQSKINYEEAVVEILFKPKISIPSTNPSFDFIRDVESLLKSVFQEAILTRLHPRTSISIIIQEIHDSGSLISAAVNAACCALTDAGVPMKSPVVGVQIKNPDSGYFDLVFDRNFDLISILTSGSINEESLQDAIKQGGKEANACLDLIRTKVKDRFIA